MKGTLAVFSYAVAVKHNDQYLTNDRFGLLVDGLSTELTRVVYVCAEPPPDDQHFTRGSDVIYTYAVKSTNVDFVTTATTARLKPIRKILKTLSIAGTYRRVVRNIDYAYIFMPGISGFIAALLCAMYKKPYFLYFGADWRETALFRADWSGAGRIVYTLYRACIGLAERVSAKHAKFILVTGKSFVPRLKQYNDQVTETVPMVTVCRDDIHKKQNLLCREHINLLFVGPVTERKGVIYLIQALPLLEHYGIDPASVSLKLVGSLEDSYWQQIVQIAEAEGIRANINYDGYVSSKEMILEYYRKSDIFVLPSLGEGFPRVLYEAFSQGLPVVASRIATIRDTLAETDCVSYSEPGSPDSIAAAIARVVNDDGFRAEIIANGMDFASARIGGDPVQQVLELMKIYVPEVHQS